MRGGRPKEVHYFDNNFDGGEAWYRSHFPSYIRLQFGRLKTGEASPYYLFHPLAPKRIAQLLPNVRLIALLRNPVDRAISHYWHEVKLGVETLPMEQALDPETETARLHQETKRLLRDETYFSQPHMHFSYLSRGRYAEQIQTYHRYFSESQLLILPSEELFAHTQATFDSVLNFIGLPPHTLADVDVRNPGSYDRQDQDTRQRLASYFESHNQRLYDYLGLDEPWW